MNIYVLHLLFTQKQENRGFINDVTRVLTGLNLIQSTIVLTVLSYWFSKREWTMGSTACKLHQFSKSFVSISTGLLISLACLTKYMTFINQLRYVCLTSNIIGGATLECITAYTLLVLTRMVLMLTLTVRYGP